MPAPLAANALVDTRNSRHSFELNSISDGKKESDMNLPAQRRMRLSGGTELAYVVAGDPSNPAMLLLHGFPASARAFRDVIPGLAGAAYVIAPDLPGHGQSDVPPTPSFAAISEAISELLAHLETGHRFIHIHDWGASVGLQIAMQSPELVSGLIIQNANAHRTGFGPVWDAVLKFWSEPTKENEAAATPDLTFEFTREQYMEGDEPPRPHGDPPRAYRRLQKPCRELRYDRRLSEEMATACAHAVGPSRPVLRHRRNAVLDAGFAAHGGSYFRRRALPA
jgi:pimeloyl-ACP methyl ester carboxylesterase